MRDQALGSPPFLTGTNLALALTLLLPGLALFFDRNLLHLALPWITSGLGVILSGTIAVPVLQRLKAGQIIREDGPQSHLKKAGTPTMGGVFVVPVALVAAVLWTKGDPTIWAASLLTLSFGFVGWLDDWQILRFKNNKGISPGMKLALLGLFSLAFCGWLFFRQFSPMVQLPLGLKLPLGLGFWPLALFALLGTSNATNLTDGLDGLAGGTGAIAAFALALLLSKDHPELTLFCFCVSGAYLGFLWHNRNPAQVFMGDTGSLALGGALAAGAILGNMLWGLLLVGALFVWESLTTILQVGYFKATKDETGVGKRLFKMAPFHHHLELSGWTETQVVGTFYLAGLGLLIASLWIQSLY